MMSPCAGGLSGPFDEESEEVGKGLSQQGQEDLEREVSELNAI